MRAFFLFFCFLSLLPLMGQEMSQANEVVENFDLLKKKIEVELKREVHPLDHDELSQLMKEVEKLQFAHTTLLHLNEISEKEKTQLNSLDFSTLFQSLKTLNFYMLVEDGVRNWPLAAVVEQLDSVQRISDQLKSNGFQFSFQFQQIDRAIFTLTVLHEIVGNSQFKSRVCSAESCMNELSVKKTHISTLKAELEEWYKKTKKTPPAVESVLPEAGRLGQ